MIEFICYSKCSTCQKAKKWLEENNLPFNLRDIKQENPTAQELKNWHEISGLPIKRFFNTSGMLYRDMGLKDKLPNMTDDEKFDLLATDGMLVKRPIVILDNTILVGFKAKDWETLKEA